MPRPKRQKSTLELAIETLKVAQLRLKLLGEIGDPKDQKRQLLAELVQARDMVAAVIDEVQELRNGMDGSSRPGIIKPHPFVRSAGDAELCGEPGCGHYASNRKVHRGVAKAT